MKCCCALLIAGLVLAGTATADAPPSGGRAAFAADWQAQGLRPEKSDLDLLDLRPGGAGASVSEVQLAPVQVEMRDNWQSANRALERASLRQPEVQALKDQVAEIVADELRQAFAQAPVRSAAAAPVLQAKVLDLYLNAPEMQTAVHTRTYTQSYGDMVLVAELRDGSGGPLLLGSWDHRPAREFSTPRLTTRVENAIEVRAVARAWARRLRGEFDRLAAGG